MKKNFLILLGSMLLLIFTGCDDNIPPPTPTPPTINDITVTGAGTPVNGKYTAAFNAEIQLGGNAENTGNAHAWTYITTPANAAKNLVFTPGAGAVNPTVSGFEKGVEYTLVLTITNQANLTAERNVTIAVSANAAPTANAGTDDSVQLSPTAAITLNGSGDDPDGTIAAYAWTLTNKPAGAADPAFNNAIATPLVSGFDRAGNYVFQLIVTDNDGAPSAPSTVTITVTAADAPAINNIAVSGAAPVDGKYKFSDTLTLGGNTAAVGYTYTWTCIPDTLTFDKSAAAPTVSGFAKGASYTFELTITNQFGVTSSRSETVNIAANVPPVANAGIDQNVTLAGNLTVTLTGAASSDADGSIASYAWECLSYTADKGAVTSEYTPAQVNALLQNANTATSTVDLRKAGTYVFRLTVTDNDGATNTNNVEVVVEANVLAPKNIEVTFPPFSPNPTVIDLNPIYTPEGGWGEYSAGDIRFEIMDDRGNDNSKFPDGTIARSQASQLYGEVLWPWSPPLFTQTFYDNDDNKLGEYEFYIGDLGDTGHFNFILNEFFAQISSLPPPSASPLILELGKTVTELP